ncbi:hypothetical protein ABH941_008070 [Streptacidiphilus sp. EB103A]
MPWSPVTRPPRRARTSTAVTAQGRDPAGHPGQTAQPGAQQPRLRVGRRRWLPRHQRPHAGLQTCRRRHPGQGRLRRSARGPADRLDPPVMESRPLIAVDGVRGAAPSSAGINAVRVPGVAERHRDSPKLSAAPPQAPTYAQTRHSSPVQVQERGSQRGLSGFFGGGYQHSHLRFCVDTGRSRRSQSPPRPLPMPLPGIQPQSLPQSVPLPAGGPTRRAACSAAVRHVLLQQQGSGVQPTGQPISVTSPGPRSSRPRPAGPWAGRP